ncbi:MAG: hypothetical protein A2504_09090 [Bdellovibrionales bacterium RIFOXYD12_FULL_39_22]|nr:MAG: hypothetical protein A2385_17460 [Bdellovibrionales bacterium RIFOXYB1_FULL_39_21]OFZ41104.1 MAG: hypothetical protein A2485_00385 [Bdellovibrionales bacterium RIFOXYC12_FULL_39_17]OFZ50317.1 MAG: hypothetical protein A2404_07700 [Bdellovibrionales bacterium RIFOXYC1_FULL_39_130]OFZ72047.1 MAG: hypothetical protein A2451_07135 [Bdellovibrionales bacterium RIFOXYC2_FULL_39_8]OFZ75118.1 MAG: hypothetical protein A2560_16395 [Bdellovibrionales bacterium RIFOXYD1_FULL_39_84]OFZ92240.1 MAG:
MNIATNIRLPLLFIFLGIIHLLFPWIMLYILKETSTLDWENFMTHVTANTKGISWFNFWLLYPLAGAAIIFAHRFTYPIVIGAHLYSIFSFLLSEHINWGFLTTQINVSPLYIAIFDIGVILYFLAPDSARVFFMAGSRWWDTKTRYVTEIPCSVFLNEIQEIKGCTIRNISQSGVFVMGDLPKVNYMNNVLLKFSFQSKNYNFKCDIVGNHTTNNGLGHGLKFIDNSLAQSWRLRILIWKVSKSSDVKQRWEVTI